MQKIHDNCTVDGCDKPHKSRGYCNTHYSQWKRGMKPTVYQPRGKTDGPCSYEGCTEPVKSKGMCSSHYMHYLRHGHLRYKHRARLDAPTCKVAGCNSQTYALDWCHKHYIKDRHMRETYGITMDRYFEMVAEQNHRCKLCGGTEGSLDSRTGKPRDMSLDHDHVTGKVRAILCSGCNRGIGLLNDDPALLRAAADYIEEHRPPA